MNQLIKTEQLTPEQWAEANKKSASWAQRGHVYTINKIAIENKALAKIAALALPTDINKLSEYDDQRKEARSFIKELKESVLEDTRPLNEYIALRNKPIKDLEEHMAKFDAALLPLKTQSEELAKAANNEAQEKANYRASVEKLRVEKELEFDTLISATVLDYYARALQAEGVNEITEPMMAKMCEHFKSTDFYMPTVHSNDEQWQIWKEVMAGFNPSDYIAKYVQQLNAKFENFKYDKLHPTEAIAQAAYETDQTLTTAQAEAELKTAMADLTQVATEQITVDHKALKKVYKVDMDDTPETMMIIDRAYIALQGYASSVSKMKSLWNLKMQQKADFIAECKNKDNALMVEGVVFKEVKKL